jgi:hypothetical protein
MSTCGALALWSLKLVKKILTQGAISCAKFERATAETAPARRSSPREADAASNLRALVLARAGRIRDHR